MSDTGSNCDNKPQQEDVNLEKPPQPETVTIPEAENKPVTPVKRTPKRLSAVERAQRESEELVKILGGSLDIEGGRKTRSSTRGTPSKSNVVNTPPPSKKARASTATPKRARGRKLEIAIEEEITTSPEKAPSEPESNLEEKESTVSDVANTEKIVEDAKSEENETPSAAEEEKASAQDDKPEPMEVDGVNKEAAKEEEAEESAQNKAESSENAIEDEPENSDKVLVETSESSKVVEEAANPPALADEKNETDDNAHVNNVKANDINASSNSLPAEASLPNPTPATPVSVAGNEQKTESNDLCEPKIVSPPITTNNEGATPQYCN